MRLGGRELMVASLSRSVKCMVIRILRTLPFPFCNANHADFDAIGGLQYCGLDAIHKWDVISKCRIKHVGQEPWERALISEV